MSDILPPIDKLLAEFDNGKVPRSKVWHTLITGLYFNFDSVNEIENWYNTVLELTSVNQQLASDIKLQHDQIEIWYGQIDSWQQQVANNKNEVDSKTAEALASSEAAAQSAKKAEEEADRATATIDKLSERFETLESGLQQVSNPNLLINGDFSVWQRGTEFNNNRSYTADRWFLVHRVGGICVRSPVGIGVSPYSLYVKPNAGTAFAFGTTVELPKTGSPLFVAGSKVTLSGWYTGSGIQAIPVALKYRVNKYDATNEIIFSVSEGYSSVLPPVAGWTKFSITYDAPAVGATHTVLLLEIGDCFATEFWFSECKLEAGNTSTTFILNDPATNLAKCQQYFYRNSMEIFSTHYNSDKWAQIVNFFPVTMRATPTIVCNTKIHPTGVIKNPDYRKVSPDGFTFHFYNADTYVLQTYTADAEI